MIETPKAGGLNGRQAQTWHLEVLASNALYQLVDADVLRLPHRDHDVFPKNSRRTIHFTDSSTGTTVNANTAGNAQSFHPKLNVPNGS